jgi:hypothetical protein
VKIGDGNCHCLLVGDEIPVHPVVHDLGRCALTERDDRRTQASASTITRPYGSFQRMGISRVRALAKSSCFSGAADLTEVAHPIVVEVWLYFLLKVGLLPRLDGTSKNQRDVRTPRGSNCMVCALDLIKSAHPQGVILLSDLNGHLRTSIGLGTTPASRNPGGADARWASPGRGQHGDVVRDGQSIYKLLLMASCRVIAVNWVRTRCPKSSSHLLEVCRECVEIRPVW